MPPQNPKRPHYSKSQQEAFEEIDAKGGDVRPDAIVTTPEGLKVRRPQMFLPDVPVVGDLEFQLLARELQKRIPHANVSKIIQGHTWPSMNAHVDSKMKPDMFGQTNLLGVYGLQDKSIGIRPDMDKELNRSTLVHELAHSRGFKESEAEDFGSAFEQEREFDDPILQQLRKKKLIQRPRLGKK
jgi:hypothetical protein